MISHLTQFGAMGRNGLFACALLALAVTTNGCAALGFFGQALFPEQIKAAYPLEDRPTLVIVDDPAHLLDDQGLVHNIAYRVGVELIQHHVLKQVVPGAKLMELAARLGDEYARMPIDQIGMQLNAEQVLHVNIKSVSVSHMQMTIKSIAKVIDAPRSIRLFPSPRHGKKATPLSQLGMVTTKLIYRPITEMGPGARSLINRDLARRVGVEVSQLFYDHQSHMHNDTFAQSPS